MGDDKRAIVRLKYSEKKSFKRNLKKVFPRGITQPFSKHRFYKYDAWKMYPTLKISFKTLIFNILNRVTCPFAVSPYSIITSLRLLYLVHVELNKKVLQL
jgi:hypothetical protein